MPHFTKLARLAVLLGLLVAALAGSSVAGAQPLATATAAELPDCYAGPCTKTLGPGQRVVLGDRYASFFVQASGTADGFGARFVVKHSYDGVNFTKVFETGSTARGFSLPLRTTMPWLFPGVFRVIAINDATRLVTTTATVDLVTY
jgi:hypothetical protein